MRLFFKLLGFVFIGLFTVNAFASTACPTVTSQIKMKNVTQHDAVFFSDLFSSDTVRAIYHVDYKPAGASKFEQTRDAYVIIPGNVTIPMHLRNLIKDTPYDLRIAVTSLCDNTTSYSPSTVFTTQS